MSKESDMVREILKKLEEDKNNKGFDQAMTRDITLLIAASQMKKANPDAIKSNIKTEGNARVAARSRFWTSHLEETSMSYSIKQEYPKKSNSKRREIFKNRARKRIEELAKSFYQGNGLRVPSGILNNVIDEIVNDFIDLSKNEEFRSIIAHPDISTDEALLDKLEMEHH